MGDYEATTTIDVAANVLFDKLKDVERLPAYLPQLADAHRTGADNVEVTAELGPDGHRESGQAWVEVVEDGRRVRWGTPGPRHYEGELDVDFVADGTCLLTVRLHTDRTDGPEVEEALHQTLAGIKRTIEAEASKPDDQPSA